jgi:hypothetical protein
MSSFWDRLMVEVDCGEMGMAEAHRRMNYYNFVEQMDGIADPARYVMETPDDELPPAVLTVVDANALWSQYLEYVRDGEMTPYDAAQAYYDEMQGDEIGWV